MQSHCTIQTAKGVRAQRIKRYKEAAWRKACMSGAGKLQSRQLQPLRSYYNSVTRQAVPNRYHPPSSLQHKVDKYLKLKNAGALTIL
jgi:hypothetical protein